MFLWSMSRSTIGISNCPLDHRCSDSALLHLVFLVCFLCVSRRKHILNSLPALGFLPGQQVKDANIGNLGLHDRTPHQLQSSCLRPHIFVQSGLPCSGFKNISLPSAVILLRLRCTSPYNDAFLIADMDPSHLQLGEQRWRILDLDAHVRGWCRQ